MDRCLIRFHARAGMESRFLVLGAKQRGEMVRYDMKSHQFLPFLSGISATDPTFSRDGKWVAYASYPDGTLWRSRSDGSERMQLTYPPMDVKFPYISPDGTQVAFHTCCDKVELFVISMDGGTSQKVSDSGFYASWSPDGNYLSYRNAQPPYQLQIIDMRTGKKSALSSSEGDRGLWVDQRPILLRVDFDEGHGLGSSRPQRERLLADQFSFVLWQSGDPEFQPAKPAIEH
jgi:hypothetical protein